MAGATVAIAHRTAMPAGIASPAATETTRIPSKPHLRMANLSTTACKTRKLRHQPKTHNSQ